MEYDQEDIQYGGNPYEDLWDEVPEDCEPDPESLSWGLAVPVKWVNRKR